MKSTKNILLGSTAEATEQRLEQAAKETEEYDSRMAEKLSRQIEQYRRWDGYLRDIRVSKTVQFILQDPNPMSDEGSFILLHAKEQPKTENQSVKPSRYELGGGKMERKVAVLINDVWRTGDEKHSYFSGAWFEAKGFRPVSLNGELLDEDSHYHNFSKMIRKYNYEMELDLLIRDQLGAEQTIKIKPLEEETIFEAVQREGKGEFGLHLEPVSVPLLPGEPKIDGKRNRDYVMMVEKSGNGSTHIDIIVLVRWISKGPGEKPEPTETGEIDEMIPVSLQSPLPTAFSHGEHPEHTIFKSHGMKLIKATHRLNFLLKIADETDPICLYYHYVPKKDIHETWNLVFDQNFPVQGMCLRNQDAFDLLTQALRRDGIERIPDITYINNVFSPLGGGQNAYLRPLRFEPTILHTAQTATSTDAGDDNDPVLQEMLARYADWNKEEKTW